MLINITVILRLFSVAFPPMDSVSVRWLTPIGNDYASAVLYAVFSTAREFLEELVVESGIELDGTCTVEVPTISYLN